LGVVDDECRGGACVEGPVDGKGGTRVPGHTCRVA
jgi:hypothetical protein